MKSTSIKSLKIASIFVISLAVIITISLLSGCSCQRQADEDEDKPNYNNDITALWSDIDSHYQDLCKLNTNSLKELVTGIITFQSSAEEIGRALQEFSAPEGQESNYTQLSQKIFKMASAASDMLNQINNSTALTSGDAGPIAQIYNSVKPSLDNYYNEAKTIYDSIQQAENGE